MFIRPDAIAKAASWLANVQTCACCGDEQDPDDMADQHFAGAVLKEATAYYRGPICCHCFESMATCAHCGNKRRERDMWSYAGPVCSQRCDADLEHFNIARDERLSWRDAT